jgi:sigma-B regulation protein RsbU (phosphoserine phosphatase)
MFMVRAISLARLLSREVAEPERILARLNDELSADNPLGMFVTFLCGVFEPASGRFTLANAGHCRPVLLRGGQAPLWAVKDLGTALGFEPGLEFKRTELELRRGDTLVFYTDGVSEAFNPQEECYGDARLLADLGGFAGGPTPDLAAGLLQKVRGFAGTAPQSDDIAILALRVESEVPAEPGKRNRRVVLELQATPEGVMEGVEALQALGRELNMGEKDMFGLALALEECGSNIVNHAYRRDPQQKFQLVLEYTGDTFSLELRDHGPEFDPTQAGSESPIASDEERPPGGWGIQLVRRYVDGVFYRRENGENVLCLRKKLLPG